MKKSHFYKTACLFVFLVSCATALARVQVQKISAPRIVARAQTFDHSGTLQVAKDGYVYLKTSNHFIHALAPLLNEKLENPACFSPNQADIGAHISIFYKNEVSLLAKAKLRAMQGKVMYFNISGIEKVTVTNYRYGERYKTVWYVLSVYSPEINDLIKKFQPHEKYVNRLHISIALSRFKNGICRISK